MTREQRQLTDIIEEKRITGDPLIMAEFVPSFAKFSIDQALLGIGDPEDSWIDVVSVTMGAGGNLTGTSPENPDEDLSMKTIQIIEKAGYTTIGHFTLHPYTPLQVQEMLLNNGIANALVIRGDVDDDTLKKAHTERGNYLLGVDLVRSIARMRNAKYLGGVEDEARDYSILVPAFPEGYPEVKDVDDGMRYLREKQDAVAQEANGKDVKVIGITQTVHDPEIYRAFVRRAKELGVHIPLVPAFKPITWPTQIDTLRGPMFDVTVPTSYDDLFREFRAFGGNKKQAPPQAQYESTMIGLEQGKALGTELARVCQEEYGFHALQLYILSNGVFANRLAKEVKQNLKNEQQVAA